MFLERGWYEFDEETQQEWDWNIWWRNARFRTSDYDKIMPWQRINHYPRSTMITKKDGLARNLKRMRGVYGTNIYNFSPTAFNLPHDYTRFVTEYTKQKEKQKELGNKTDMYWICKPADMSRGRGIFVFKDLSDLTYDCTAVVQRYISHPYLIGGYKFDLRIYVSVPSYHPLRIYIHEEGLVRFSTDKYDLDKLGNLFSHLTNTSINKHSPMYGADKDQIGSGCKWTITQLRHYFRQENINDRALWLKIINIIILTLIMQHSQVPPAENCYELYGFDIIIDENLKPWLLEVNFSPAMGCDSHVDIQVKKPLLHDMLDMLEFKAEDCKRGGLAHRRNMINKSRTYDTDRFRYGKKYQTTNKGRKFPHISSGGSSCGSSDRPCSSGGSDEETDEPKPVPVLPGYGLPSVQVPRSSETSRRDSKRRSKSTDPFKSNFEDWRSQPQSTVLSRKCTKSTTDTSEESAQDSSQSVAVAYTKKRSTIPSFNIVDTCASVEKLSVNESNNKSPSRLVFSDKERIYESMHTAKVTTTENAYNNFLNPILRGTRGSSAPSNASNVNVPLKEKNTSSQQHRRHHIKEENIKADSYGDENDRSDSKPLRQREISNRKLATATPLHKNYQSGLSSRSNPKFVERYGGFYLVFPFNDATRKCAVASTLDLRTVVVESYKALQQALHSKEKSFTPLWTTLSQLNDSSS